MSIENMNLDIFIEVGHLYDIYYIYIGTIHNKFNIYIEIENSHDAKKVEYTKLMYRFKLIENNKKINFSTLPDNIKDFILAYKKIINKLKLIVDILNEKDTVVYDTSNHIEMALIDYIQGLFPNHIFFNTCNPFTNRERNEKLCTSFIKNNYSNKLDNLIYKNTIIKDYKEKSKVFQGTIQGLETVYKDNYDFRIDSFDKNLLKFTIKFPKLTIKNKKKHEHKLYNLFTSFYLDVTKDTIKPKITGFRTKYSIREFKKEYCHSHLSGNILVSSLEHILDNPYQQIIQETGFCLGSGPFTTLLYSLSRDFDIDKFVLFLHYLKGFLSWESLQGGPYKYITSIIKYTKLKNHNVESIPNDEDIFKKLDLKNNLKFNKNKFEYKPNKNVIKQTTDYFKNSNLFRPVFVCATDHNGNYYNLTNYSSISHADKTKAQEINNKKIKITEFQDEPVYLELIDEETNDNLEITLKKGFYEKVTETINNIKTKKDYTNYIARRKSKINSFINSIK